MSTPHDNRQTADEVQALALGNGDSTAFTPLATETSQEPTIKEGSPEFRERCKAFESGANSLWSIPLGILERVAIKKAKKVLPDDEDKIDSLLEDGFLSDDGRKAAKEATARIVARRCKSGEAMDVAILAGVAAEIGTNFSILMSELKRMEAKQAVIAKKDKA